MPVDRMMSHLLGIEQNMILTTYAVGVVLLVVVFIMQLPQDMRKWLGQARP